MLTELTWLHELLFSVLAGLNFSTNSFALNIYYLLYRHHYLDGVGYTRLPVCRYSLYTTSR